ncbi:pyridoxal-dependent decarboxylase [Tropicimonas sp. IMCC6043]|uniref:pyridoxal phosphate-dependent decarboxylase family protein n=1 Tax=Tropicimonas sp. IMCC6043 TaxID=2510645 RepID=UPI00101BF90E|nr:pyridoxal-dependent decarboxylase [Tropicimonas sp. IMCC6043]RYH07379.1 aspartate aminotransferase family protein [Tropicimonas sp. IMCC6043]
MTDQSYIQDAERRARQYLETVRQRRVYPDDDALAALSRFDEALPDVGRDGAETVALLDEAGSPATVASNGPNYYGFVIGGTLPEVLAVERLTSAWDQCASSFTNSPVAHKLEKVAARWLLDVLELPTESAVTFGTTATSCGIACISAARRTILARQGWDFDDKGLAGAPPVRVVVSDTIHVTLLKILRVLGFGLDTIVKAPVDQFGRVDPDRLPSLDDRTILCLQAGEVNTGEFDPFERIIPQAKAAGAWVHVDGAFGLWARTSGELRHLVDGIEQADSWTVDGHKWLNTPYDGAMGICRDAEALGTAMNSAAAYSIASADSQMNLGVEFSRRARGIAIWAALRSLGRDGLEEMFERHCRQARTIAKALTEAGVTVLNRVVLNQVVFRLDTDDATWELPEHAAATGGIWFGPTAWQGRPACRISVANWQSNDETTQAAVAVLTEAIASLRSGSASGNLTSAEAKVASE